MRGALLILAMALLIAVPAPAEAEDSFRIAVETGASEPCRPVAKDAPSGLQAYARLLAVRLEKPITICPTVDRAASAALLAGGGADLAMLDAKSFVLAGASRAILTPRAPEDFGRVEMVALVGGGSKIAALSDLAGAKIALGGAGRLAAEGPYRALADHGVAREMLAPTMPAADPEAALDAVRAGRVDAAVLHVSAWRRVCRGNKPGDEPCKDLRVVWRGRPRPAEAVVAPLSMPEPLRYRLIGVHIAMHLEAPEAFAWAARGVPGAKSFDATEAGALTAGLR